MRQIKSPDDITLIIGGKKTSGATSITLRRGLYQTASELSITAPYIFFADWIHLAGTRITLAADGALLFTGEIDEVAADFAVSPDSAEQSVNIRARSLTAILTDCTVPTVLTAIPQDQLRPITILDWCHRMGYEFGIEAVGDDNGEPIETGIDPSPEQTAEEFLRHLAARRLVFLTDNPDGNLRVIPAKKIAESRATAQNIKQDIHLTQASSSASTVNRFYEIVIKYDDGGGDMGEVVAKDECVKNKNRRNTIITKNKMKRSEAQDLAYWHIARQKNDFAYSGRLTGGVWIEPGEIVNIHAPAIGVDGNAAITDCEITIDGIGGLSSTFSATPPSAVIPAPVPREDAADQTDG